MPTFTNVFSGYKFDKKKHKESTKNVYIFRASIFLQAWLNGLRCYAQDWRIYVVGYPR